MIKLVINGNSVTGENGSTILEVAKANSIRIPTLCSSEKVKPLGSCGVCVVEVAGETVEPALQPAETQVSDLKVTKACMPLVSMT